ncbi:VOC family protein [Gordonia sp. CPCC 205515]|uniref:VOC family protein n=1 Tax=Gordonia sp. CPCC 205515 TaxID=3140791 RepID=UPI003AF3C791
MSDNASTQPKSPQPLLNEPFWVDLVTPDVSAARSFYTALFQWEYVDNGRQTIALLDDQPVCGIWPGSAELANGASYWHPYFRVGDLNLAASEARRAGGELLWGPSDYLGAAQVSTIQDPAGASMSLWEPTISGRAVMNALGASSWFELVTPDPMLVADFYQSTLRLTPDISQSNQHSYRVLTHSGIPVAGVVRSNGPSHWRTYFLVDDLDRALRDTTKERGSIASPPQHTLIGDTALIRDPAGALLGLVAKLGAPQSPVNDNAGFPNSLNL